MRHGGKYGHGYVVMFGQHGYMPDYSFWAPNKKGAIEMAVDEIDRGSDGGYQVVGLPDFPYTEEQINAMVKMAIADVRKHMYAELNNDIWGWQYCEIADAEEEWEEE
jgi:hypothetical protein